MRHARRHHTFLELERVRAAGVEVRATCMAFHAESYRRVPQTSTADPTPPLRAEVSEQRFEVSAEGTHLSRPLRAPWRRGDPIHHRASTLAVDPEPNLAQLDPDGSETDLNHPPAGLRVALAAAAVARGASRSPAASPGREGPPRCLRREETTVQHRRCRT
jgi:hypothetical protein